MLSPQYWCYPPHVLMLSLHSTESLHSTDPDPTVLNSLLSTDPIPLQYCSYPSSVLNGLYSIDVLPPHVLQLSLRSTEQPPQYWSYFFHCTDAIPHSTDAIPHSTEQPLQYWCYPPHVLMPTPTVLNSLRSTEPTLYGVITSSNQLSKVLIGSAVEDNSMIKERFAIPGMITSSLPKFWNVTSSNWFWSISLGLWVTITFCLVPFIPWRVRGERSGFNLFLCSILKYERKLSNMTHYSCSLWSVFRDNINNGKVMILTARWWYWS